MNFVSSDSIFPVCYSFVTLTTLGDGDIYPVAPIAQMLAVVEALIGQQFYLVVIVARLVGLHIAYAANDAEVDKS